MTVPGDPAPGDAAVPAADVVLANLLREALEAAPWRVPQVAVDVLGRACRVRRLRLLLVDHELVELHDVAVWPVSDDPPDDSPGEQGSYDVEGGADDDAGRAFRLQQQTRTSDGRCVCQPVSVRGHRLGVLVADLAPAVDTGGAAALLAAAATVVAVLLRQAVESGDLVEVRRRSHVFSVAAEMQWDVLPPPEHRGPGVEVAALVEPAYLATSDLFDWAVDAGVVTVSLLEAAGEGLGAARAADLALAGLRHARRSGLAAADQLLTADDVLHREHRGGAAVDAVLVRLDLRTGAAELHVAGTAAVLHHRGSDVRPLDLPEGPPLGAGEEDRPSRQVRLAPGDVLVLLSSGVLQALSHEGHVFGLDGVRRALARADDVLDAPRSVARAVRAHCGGEVGRDATCLVLRWVPEP